MSRRLVKINVSMPFLQEILAEGWRGCKGGYVSVCTEGLPEGATLNRTYMEGPNQEYVTLVFEHESFDSVEPGREIPTLTPEHKLVRHEDETDVALTGEWVSV